MTSSYEGFFGIKPPEPGKTTLDDIMRMIEAQGNSLKTDTSKLATDVTLIRNDIEGVKVEQKAMRTDVNDLQRRIEVLEAGKTGEVTVSKDQIVAVEEAKRIVVFFPVEGYSNTRSETKAILMDICEKYKMAADVKKYFETARFFQTKAGAENDSIHVEFESPWAAKRVLLASKTRTWESQDKRVNTRIFIPGILRERADKLEKLGADLRARGRQHGEEKITTQIRFVSSDLVLFIKIGEGTRDYYSVDYEDDMEKSIQHVKTKAERKTWHQARENQNKQARGKIQQRPQRSENPKRHREEVGIDNHNLDGLLASPPQSGSNQESEPESNDNSRTRTGPKRKLTPRRRYTPMPGQTPLFHHQAFTFSTKQMPIPKKLQSSKRSVITVPQPSFSTDDNNIVTIDEEESKNENVYSVDGSDDINKQLISGGRAQAEGVSQQLRGGKDKNYSLSLEKLNEKTAAKFQQEKPYTVRPGKIGQKKGKVTSIMLILNTVYHQALKDIILKDMRRGWVKVMSEGDISVTKVDPRLDKKGILDTTQVSLKWKNGMSISKTTVHVYHTTKDIHLQGDKVTVLWEKILQPMFDNLIANNKHLKTLSELARERPEEAARAATAGLMTVPVAQPAVTGAGKRLCDICGKARVHEKEICSLCQKVGHKSCGWSLAKGICKFCREENDLQMRLSSTAGALELLTKKSDEEIRRRKAAPTTPTATPPPTTFQTPTTTPRPSPPQTPIPSPAQSPDHGLQIQHSVTGDHETLSATSVPLSPLEIEYAPSQMIPVTQQEQTRQMKDNEAATRGRRPPVPTADKDPWEVEQLQVQMAQLRHENETLRIAVEQYRRVSAAKAASEIMNQGGTSTGGSTVVVKNNFSMNVKAENLTAELSKGDITVVEGGKVNTKASDQKTEEQENNQNDDDNNKNNDEEKQNNDNETNYNDDQNVNDEREKTDVNKPQGGVALHDVTDGEGDRVTNMTQ